jgi:hypothetical protein
MKLSGAFRLKGACGKDINVINKLTLHLQVSDGLLSTERLTY